MEKKKQLEMLHAEISSCRKCRLHLTRRNAVPGEGPCDAAIFLIGEAPGAKEDQTGRPFAGRAGRVLEHLLKGTGIARGDVFITSILKCRPPDNREPRPEEVNECQPYLWSQLNLVKPAVVVPMGRHALRQALLLLGMGEFEMREVHGTVLTCEAPWGRIRLVPVYHPAAATHNPRMRGVLEQDFSRIREQLL